MHINIKDKVNYKNFSSILGLINNVNIVDLNGLDQGQIKNVNIDNVTLEQYCNFLNVSHFSPKDEFNLTNISMIGKYNVIKLTDLPRGKYYLSTDTIEENVLDENLNNVEQIDEIFTEIQQSSNTILIKNKSNDEIAIGNFDPKIYKVFYLKNISGDTKTPTINLTYENNNCVIIAENTKANFIINNESINRVHCANNNITDENILVPDEEIIEGFSCLCKKTSPFQMLLIAVVIYIFFKLLTERETIKLFN
tara:strand:+ start:487 stop:1242 length:756 start_codon:yes stop_codon:yes gene_type:complete